MMGKTAWIDLTDKTVAVQETDSKLMLDFVGSRGIAAKILYDNVGTDVKPFDPENLLIFSTGPFTGTPWPSAARYTVTSKSPATGAYGYSNSSGFFGPEMKKAGYDVLIFSGKSQEPVYLLVEDDMIEILDASEYWGQETGEVEKALREIYVGSRVASIGPAGENKVCCASVINDYGRAAGRTGMGAVMGDKKLKALVVKNNEKKPINKDFMNVVRRVTPLVKDHPGAKDYTEWGTVILLNYKNKGGDNPSKNHAYGQFPYGDELNAQAIKKYTKKTGGCYACSIKCARFTEVKDGPFKTPLQEGPEYETANALGPNVWNKNPELLIYCNKLCNDMGIDTISVGVLIAFAMEAKEKGLLTDDNYNLEWGDADTIKGLIEDIAKRHGKVGQLLADGVKNAGKTLGGGAEDFALHCKNVEIPRQDGRVLKGMALGHATSNRGADHLYALPTIALTGNMDVVSKVPELAACGPELMDTTKEDYKAVMVRWTEVCNALADALGICKFAFTETYAIMPKDLAEGLRALGIDMTEEALFKAGQRIINLERMYNVRHGFRKIDDMLPKRFLEEPLDVYVHPEDIEKVSRDEAELVHKGLMVDLEPMLDEYYQLGKWDEDGIPREERLQELGLEECLKDLPLTK
jgi:aldehyde:ferredoxin oxidoreductase